MNRKFISKTSLLTPVVKDFRTGETGELGLNISGTRTQIYSAPTRHSPGISSSLFLFLVLERALLMRHSARQGYFLWLPFFSIFISVHASIPHHILLILLKGKHLFQGTDLSRLSSVTAGICDYLMGLADYEKACFTVGFPRKGKMGRWTFGSQLNYA